MSSPSIVLLGAGHAHVEVLRQRLPNVTLIASEILAPYSGLLPALLRGEVTHAQAHIDAAALARATGATFQHDRAVSIDRATRRILCASGTIVPYDLLSINVGATPGMPPGEGIAVKPIARLLASLPPPGTQTAIIGAGAAGAELALALRHNITLIGTALVPEAPPRARRIIAAHLARAGIAFRQATATGFDGASVLTTAAPIPAEAAIWATPARAPGFLAASDLACDTAGCLLLTPTLQSIDDRRIFAAGDCAATNRPKAGVWAVRAGPILAENLRRAAQDRPLLPWRPQTQALVILGLGNGTAVAWRNGVTVAGAWVARWKASLDRRFMERYQVK